MRILAIGDVVARAGRQALARHLQDIQLDHDIDFTVVNIENAAGGSGLTQKVYDEFLQLDIDVMTSGNHIFDKKEIFDFIDHEPTLLRPENYPPGTAGTGWCVATAQNGEKVAVMNTMGQAFMYPTVNCPFQAFREIEVQIPAEVRLRLLDFHAETTSEKMAMGWYVNGKITGIWGTHTHVPTADERVLDGGTAYISDLGMTGCYNSVIGTKTEPVLEKFVRKHNTRWEPATGRASVCGVIIDADPASGKATAIERVRMD